MIPSTVDRVPRNTADEINARIRQRTEESIAWTVRKGPAAISRRLDELDEEWDVERLLETNAAAAVLVGLILGTTANRKFLLLPIAVAGFLLMHAIQGWCPPLPVFRRLGIRTQAEIEEERYTLKALRGDFERIGGDGPRNADRVASAVSAARA